VELTLKQSFVTWCKSDSYGSQLQHFNDFTVKIYRGLSWSYLPRSRDSTVQTRLKRGMTDPGASAIKH